MTARDPVLPVTPIDAMQAAAHSVCSVLRVNDADVSARTTAAPAGDAAAKITAGSAAEGATFLDASVEAAERLIEEVPIAFVFNGVSHAVMMATPVDLEDFAVGFALTEGIVAARAEIYGVEIETVADGMEVRCEIAAARFARLKERRRTLAGRTGCGLCGVDSLREAVRKPDLPQAGGETGPQSFAPAAIRRAIDALHSFQPLHAATGAAHAAAWADRSGAIVLVREDVGRHNALDKLVGAAVRAQIPPAAGFAVVTSRASYELVQKTAVFGARCLVAVSAPTALAARCARESGITLVGFARAGRLSYYR